MEMAENKAFEEAEAEQAKNPAAEAFRRAVEILGGQVKTAAALGVSQAAVSYYIVRKRPVPAPWALKVEAATTLAGAPIGRAQLRPDVYRGAEGAGQ